MTAVDATLGVTLLAYYPMNANHFRLHNSLVLDE